MHGWLPAVLLELGVFGGSSGVGTLTLLSLVLAAFPFQLVNSGVGGTLVFDTGNVYSPGGTAGLVYSPGGISGGVYVPGGSAGGIVG